MVSDVLFDSVKQIERYLNNGFYNGELMEEITALKNIMNDLRIKLDTTPEYYNTLPSLEDLRNTIIQVSGDEYVLSPLDIKLKEKEKYLYFLEDYNKVKNLHIDLLPSDGAFLVDSHHFPERFRGDQTVLLGVINKIICVGFTHSDINHNERVLNPSYYFKLKHCLLEKSSFAPKIKLNNDGSFNSIQYYFHVQEEDFESAVDDINTFFHYIDTNIEFLEKEVSEFCEKHIEKMIR